jgi:hypothetical protein
MVRGGKKKERERGIHREDINVGGRIVLKMDLRGWGGID